MTDSRPPGPGTARGRSGGTGAAPGPGDTGATDITDSGDGLRLAATTRPGGVVVIAVEGELDILTGPGLRTAVTARIPDAALVVLELDGVQFLGTSGLAALIEIREEAHRAGVELRLACAERRVLRPLGIAGLDHLFDIHEGVQAALDS
ncbi:MULTISPECIES: STAS domain-containing protein [unclassified Pseudonocardia]|uniref:STAS domain-containing protein n=1 Tax=unclassified Pseudonocardia TaxID=2619320 RepID=UPI0001FFE992|nr:STAS domain-containing protein [Pseudonocardia sp. Ae707_Ps1]OLM16913.1 Anti-sigma F factor antagonist (spoIIAA-2), Anti-sigma B factor antagonist RsbV [Pseudonocardia sp. Ae707_Ps1]